MNVLICERKLEIEKGIIMADINDDFRTVAMQQAIYMSGELELEGKPVEERIASRANIIYKIFTAMTTSRQTSAEEIKGLLERK